MGIPISQFAELCNIFKIPINGATPNPLNFLGTWNASTNTPTLTSSVGVANTFYVVSVAGNTNLNGISSWAVGDWVIFNGSVWGKVPFTSFPVTYLGTWNANTNTPTLTSSVGTPNTFYTVSVAGNTNLNGISNWLVGDWVLFNGSVWQKVPFIPAAVVQTITGDSGVATASVNNINLQTGYPGGCGATISFDASGNTINFQVSDNNGNIFLGALTGSATPGLHNQVFGNESFDSLTFGGSHNTSAGRQCGTNYTANESSNILIRNSGVSGDNNVARIGTRGTGPGQQNRCFLPGGYGVATLPGARALGQDVNGELCEIPSSGSEVDFENNFYIAGNGDDTTGDGSLSKPFLTGTKTQAVIVAASPSATNRFYVHDQRTPTVSEDLKWIPFVKWEGQGKTDFSGNLSLDSLLASIATDAWSWWGGYRNYDAAKTMTYDVSALSTSNAIHLTLANAEKCPCTYSIIGNDSANFSTDTFLIEEINFNTSGRNVDHTYWQANTSISSGVMRRVRFCEGTQISSITKSLGSSLATTTLDIAFCNTIAFQPSLGTLAIINSGGASNQPSTKVKITACDVEGFYLNLDITNDGNSPVNFTLDNSVTPNINSANDLTNITFSNDTYLDRSQSQYSPVNFTAAPWTDPSGISIQGGTYGSMLKGIDDKFGSITAGLFPQSVTGLRLTRLSSTQLTIGVGSCANSNNTRFMTNGGTITLNTAVSGAGGLDTGSFTDNTDYGTFLLTDSNNVNPPSGVWSLNRGIGSVPAPMPAGYDTACWVGSIKTGSAGTGIMDFIQTGNSNERTYTWVRSDASLQVLINFNSTSATPVSCAGAVSPDAQKITGIKYNFILGTTSGNKISFYYADTVYNTAIYQKTPGYITGVQNGAGVFDDIGELPLNSSLEIACAIDSNAGAGLVNGFVTGYVEYI